MQFSYRERLEFLSGVLKEGIDKVEFRSWKGFGWVWTGVDESKDLHRPGPTVYWRTIGTWLKMEASDASFHASGVKPFNELA